MSTSASSSNRPPPEVIASLIDKVAWAKTCVMIAAGTSPDSVERAGEMVGLREAVVAARGFVAEILSGGQEVPWNLLVELRVCELAIPKLEAGAVLRRQSAGSST